MLAQRAMITAPIIVGMTWSLFVPTTASRDIGSAIASLEQEKIIDHSFDKAGHVLASHLSVDLPHRTVVAINQPYDTQRLHIYTVDVDRSARAAKSDREHRLVALARHNLLAVRPNVIFIDTRFIKGALLDIFNDQIALIQAIEASHSLAATREDEISTILGMADRLRLGNVAALEDKSFDKYTEPLLSITDDGVIGAFHFPLLALVAHELNHLQNSQDALAFPSALLPSSLAILMTKRNEDAADRFALMTVNSALIRAKNENQAVAERDAGSLVSLGKQLDAQFLSTLFEKFRGLNAGDFLVELRHGTCSQKPLKHEVPSDPFYDLDWLKGAAPMRLPLLTKPEFAAMERIVGTTIEATHAHLLERALQFIKEYEVAFPNPSRRRQRYDFSRDAALLQALITGEPRGMVRFDGRMPTRLSAAQLLRNLNEFVMEKAVVCGDETCTVAFDDRAWGYVEIVERTGQVVEAVFVTQLPYRGDVAPGGPTDKAALQTFYAGAHVFTFIRNAIGDDMAKALFSQTYAANKECGAYSTAVVKNDVKVSVRTMSPSSVYRIRVTANEPDGHYEH